MLHYKFSKIKQKGLLAKGPFYLILQHINKKTEESLHPYKNFLRSNFCGIKLIHPKATI